MPVYTYKAQNANGKTVKGSMNATDEQELHIRLKEKELFLLSAKEGQRIKRAQMLKPQAVGDFSRQVGTLVGSGVSLVRALAIICQQESIKPQERAIYQELLRSVRQGIPLSDAMESLSGAFPALIINMYRSAEAGGNLDRVAMRMAEHYDKEWRLNGKVKSSMLYPKILGILLVGVVCIIMGYVLPQFEDMFAGMESLPLPTVILMGIADVVSDYWYILLAAVVVLIIGWNFLMKIPKVRLAKDKMMVKLPMIGKLEKVIYTARFARTLSSLYSSGLPIVTGLGIARHTIGNSYIDQQFDQVISYVRSGGNLSDGLSKIDGFIKKLEFSVRVGEETGSLDSMLETTADALDYESEQALNRLVSYLEPAMIVIMALIVGFVMLAVIVPIYSSYQTIGTA